MVTSDAERRQVLLAAIVAYIHIRRSQRTRIPRCLLARSELAGFLNYSFHDLEHSFFYELLGMSRLQFERLAEYVCPVIDSAVAAPERQRLPSHLKLAVLVRMCRRGMLT